MSKYIAAISNKRSKSFWQKIPISWYLLLFMVIASIGFLQLKPTSADADSSIFFLYHFIQNFLWITTIIVIAFCFLSSFIPWFIWKKNKQTGFKASIQDKDNDTLQIQLPSLLRPIGGYIRLRFVFAHHYTSQPVVIEPIAQPSSDNNSKTYIVHTSLPNIHTYNLEKLVFYFTDFLQFFRFPLTIDKNHLIVQTPQKQAFREVQIRPQKTQDETEKVFSNRKTRGDLLHFKQYESNDDIRRIVWPLYAKTGELVVRHPEIQNQYASDALIYASFYNSVAENYQEKKTLSKMLDFYKNIIYTSYKKLKDAGDYSIFLTSDQNSNKSITSDREVKNHIAGCSWQKTQSLKNINKKEDISLLVISSLDDADDVALLLQNQSNTMEILFVPLSEAFKSPTTKQWIKWVFTSGKENKNIWEMLRWRTSPLHKKILENEIRLQQLVAHKQTSLLTS